MSPPSSLVTGYHVGLLLGLFFDPENGVRHVPSKRRFTFSGPHGVISQMIELYETQHGPG
jgi:hypothetical protein